ncbi:MAG: hypothetical protein KH431_10720 [Erysipelotrichaceae bacterium]|nr:hypothetical protein [Erysipelotrichaceae bacterium]
MELTGFDKVVWRPLVLKNSDCIIKSKELILSVNGKSGRISFNAAVCESFPQILFYNAAEILTGNSKSENGNANFVAFRFMQKDDTKTAFPLKKTRSRTRDDKICGCYILSRQLARMMNETDSVQHFHLCKCGETVLAITEPFHFDS